MDRSPFALFGERAAALLQDWQQDNKRRLFAVAPIDSGGSGALLVSVSVRDVSKTQRKRRMIIKLCPPKASGEAKRFRDAWDSCPGGDTRFREAHLVELLYDPLPVDNGKLVFQAVAGGEKMVTLGAILRQERLPGIAAAISKSLLAEWNPDDDGSEMTATAFVAELLDQRAAPDSDLAAWIRENVGVAPDEAWVRLPDHGMVPNPMCLREGCPLDKGSLTYAVRGRAHGDLHPDNVMVPEDTGSSSDDFVLIDLSRFSEKALLARDPVHLLLGLVAAGFLPHLTGEARAELIDLLIGRQPSGLLIPQGLRRLVDDTRGATVSWARDELAIWADWKHQWLLSLQACALMFTARDEFRKKPFHDADRLWFYTLAAKAAEAYLQDIDRYEPGAPPAVRTLPIPPKPTAPPITSTTETPAAPTDTSAAKKPTAPTGGFSAELRVPPPTRELDPAPLDTSTPERNQGAETLRTASRQPQGPAAPDHAVTVPLAFDPQPLRTTLDRVRGVFERPLEHLVNQRAARAMQKMLQSVAFRAGLLDRQLSEEIRAAGAGLPASADRALRRVQHSLRLVASQATDLRLLLDPVETGSVPAQAFYAFGNPSTLRGHLVKSLEALLTATRVADQLLAHS